jgi:fatty-acyl-CoA synthase
VSAEQDVIARIFRHANDTPDKPFAMLLRSGEEPETTSYRTLRSAALAFGAWCQERGVQQGDHVTIMLGYGSAVFSMFLGAMTIGAIPSIFPAQTEKQHPELFWPAHQATFDRIEPRVIVTDERNGSLLRKHTIGFVDRVVQLDEILWAYGCEPLPAPANARDGAVAFLQHSSGTTGLKKGVQLSHAAVCAQIDSYAAALRMHRDDRVVSWLPLYHDMGLIACFVMPAMLGVTTIFLDPFEWVLEPWTFLDAVEKYGASLTWLPNFAFQHLVRTAPAGRQWNLSSLRALVNCSEPCKPDTVEKFLERFRSSGLTSASLQVCYAMAENVFAATQTNMGSAPRTLSVARDALLSTGAVVSSCDDASESTLRYLSCGSSISGTHVKIVDERGSDRAPGSVGEICVTGSSLFGGYHRYERPGALVDGWYRTGDLGFMHDGELYVTGRKDDLLIVRGKNIYAHDVESALEAVDVRPGRAVALGVFNEQVGSQDLVIVAEADESRSRRELTNDVKAAVYASTGTTASDVRFVEPGWLVKTTSGKISREANLRKYLVEFRGER